MVSDVPEEQSEPQAQHDRLLHFLERSGKQCMELLTAFYYDKLSMQRIAARFGFSGERSATVQKYKCLEKVRTAVHQKNMQYDDFLA
jgi:predicted DNA-binding protein YlxM (UPF0122 family)